MNRPRVLPFFCLALALLGAADPIPAKTENPTALVCLLERGATAAEPSRKPRGLALYDWLPAGTKLATQDGARVVLVFANGERWEMGARSRSRVKPFGLSRQKGTVRKLDSVPMIPSMARIKAEGKAGTYTIRATETGGFRALSPGDGESALAGEARLTFQPPPGSGKFRVEIEDKTRNPVFSAEAQEPEVRVPAGILKPGTLYFWRVRTLDAAEAAVSSETGFTTVPEEHAQIRAKLKAEADRSPDPDLRALLEEMDRWLGLRK